VPEVEARSTAGLTDAERDVLTRILAGDSNETIAKARGSAVRTVANQIASIFRKLGVSSRAELAALDLE
jgi:DNA-binding CsgD family transcriptional regulator